MLDLAPLDDRLAEKGGQVLAGALEDGDRLVEQRLATSGKRLDAAVQVAVEGVGALRQLLRQAGEQARQQPAGHLARVAQPVQGAGVGETGHGGGEIAGGHVFEMVRLVEDDALEGGQHGGSRIVVGLHAHRQVGEQQGVVDHQHLGAGGTAAGAVEEALSVVGAAHAGALVDFAAHLVPDLVAGDEGEILPGTVDRRFRPLGDGREFAALLVLEQPRFATGARQATQAQVVAATLDQFGAEIQAGGALQKGQVLADELFLQVDGVGRDDHPLFVVERPEDRRDQVGETLACAGAGFDGRQLA